MLEKIERIKKIIEQEGLDLNEFIAKISMTRGDTMICASYCEKGCTSGCEESCKSNQK